MNTAPRAFRILSALLGLALSTALPSQRPPQQPTRPEPTAPTNAPQSVPAPDAAPSAQDVERLLDQGRTALRLRDFAAAMRAFAPLAQKGHAESECLVALMHQKGYGVPADAEQALRWYTRSAVHGHADAFFMLGQLYHKGEGVARDLGKAADLFLLSAATGDADGQWAFGYCLSKGQGRARNPIEAYAWFLLSSQAGQTDAKKELDGTALDQDDVRAATALAEQLRELIRTHGFDPAKLPKVPVPEGMVIEPATTPDAAATVSDGEVLMLEAGMAISAEMLANGDMRGTATLSLPAPLYQSLRKLIPDPKLYLRDLNARRSDQELAPDARAPSRRGGPPTCSRCPPATRCRR